MKVLNIKNKCHSKKYLTYIKMNIKISIIDINYNRYKILKYYRKESLIF